MDMRSVKNTRGAVYSGRSQADGLAEMVRNQRAINGARTAFNWRKSKLWQKAVHPFSVLLVFLFARSI